MRSLVPALPVVAISALAVSCSSGSISSIGGASGAGPGGASAGGASTGGASAGGPSAGGASAGGASTGGSNTGGGNAGSGNAGGGESNCDSWPSGEPGVATGQVVPEGQVWEGFFGGSGSPGTTSIADYYDCDGKKGINAILFITAATTCDRCKHEAKSLEARMDEWVPLGIKVVTLMYYPDTVAAAQSWKSTYGLNRVDVLADKDGPVMAYTSPWATPLHTIVDPRTMRVIHTKMAAGSDFYANAVELAKKNK